MDLHLASSGEIFCKTLFRGSMMGSFRFSIVPLVRALAIADFFVLR
jgi:hypothetical protein